MSFWHVKWQLNELNSTRRGNVAATTAGLLEERDVVEFSLLFFFFLSVVVVVVVFAGLPVVDVGRQL